MSLEDLKETLADRYRLEREIGAGGMATVWLAEDLKHHRQVAVKVLRPELSAAMGPARFRREIEIAAGLHHPHIMPLFDSGNAAGLLYYVMPFEEGETLRARLKREGRLENAAAARMMHEVADALAHAHAKGVVHRDIKPENILCSGQHVLVTDFGIAKAISTAVGGADRPEHPGASDLPATALTMAGTSLGTPAYMAPEQVAGDPDADHRVDIYALGVMAYEALAGAPPFAGQSAQQILAAHLAQQPAPIRDHRAEVPAELEAIVMRCLEKEPSARWQSADELSTAIESLDTGSHANTAPTRRRWPIYAAVVALLLVAIGITWYTASGRAGTLIGSDVLAADDQVMVAEFTNRTTDSTLAATVTDAIRIELQESPVVKVLSQREMWDGMEMMKLAPGAELPDSSLRELALRLNVKAFVVGEVAPLGVGYQLTARTIATADGSEALVVRTTASDAAGLIGAVGDLGRKLRRGIGESIRSVASTPELALATTGSLPALKAFSAGLRAEVGGRRSDAVAYFTQAVALDSTFASAWGALGVAQGNSNRWAAARDAMTQAFRRRSELPEGRRASIEYNYYSFMGETEKAAAILQQQTELNNRGWTSYADVLLGLGRLAEAEHAARRGIEEMPTEPVSWWNLVEAQLAQQKFAAADSTIATMRDSLPGNPWADVLAVRTLMARRQFTAATEVAVGLRDSMPGFAKAEQCLGELTTGQLAAWQQCAMPESWAVQDPTLYPHLVLAELRMTGDTARARRQLARIDSLGVDSIYTFNAPSLIAAWAEIGDIRRARDHLASWRRAVGPDDPRNRIEYPYVAGAIAMAEGKYDSAATAFLAWNQSGDLTANHWYNRGLVEAGMALDRAGQRDSAMVLYQEALAHPSISNGAFYETAWYPEVLRRLGELHEQRGDTAKALDYYSSFLDLWKDADPVLEPQVAAVQARVKTLAGEGG